jgi:hypothetical protein
MWIGFNVIFECRVIGLRDGPSKYKRSEDCALAGMYTPAKTAAIISELKVNSVKAFFRLMLSILGFLLLSIQVYTD